MTERSRELIPETRGNIGLYWNERSVIGREDDVDGRASVTKHGRASAARRLNGDEVMHLTMREDKLIPL